MPPEITARRASSLPLDGRRGHAVFAASLIALGLLGLAQGDALWLPVPKGPPAHAVLARLSAVASLACGAALLWRRTAISAARLLLGYLLLWTVMFKAPLIVLHPAVEGYYQSCGENAVLVAGAWVLYDSLATDRDRRLFGFATDASGLRIARLLYGLAMIAFGLSHFAYLDLTAPLVPGWLPGHVAWAYFTGATYLAAGAAVLAGVYARLAAALSALQMGLFTLLVWVPRAVAGDLSPFQWGEFALSWALTSAAWVVVDSYRAAGWLAWRLPPAPRGMPGAPPSR